MLRLLFFVWLLLFSSSTIVHSILDDGTKNSIIIQNSNGGCIGLDGGEMKEGTRLMLVECDHNRTDIVWDIDDAIGVFRSSVDHNYCWTARMDRPNVLKLRKCKKGMKERSQQFEIFDSRSDETHAGQQIRFNKHRCVVYRGVTANINQDPLVIKKCNLVPDHNRKEWKLLKTTSVNETIKNEFLDPFDVDLPYFSGEITKGYSHPDLADFNQGLARAAGIVLNKAIKNNLNPDSYISPFSKDNHMHYYTASESVPIARPGGESDATDFETNVQEQGVDEADIIKADANNIYASYGDYIIVWDKDGVKKKQLKMPDIPELNPNDDLTNSFYFYWKPKPQIDSLLLASGYLVVFVSGYGDAMKEDFARPVILKHYLDTQIRVYSTPNLELQSVKNINGRFVDARMVSGQYIHAVTMSAIDTYESLTESLNRFRYFPNLSDEEYYVTAQEQARNGNLPEFIKSMREELVATGKFPSFLQINRWQKDVPNNERILDASFSEGVANNIAWVTSFDVTTSSIEKSTINDKNENELSVTSSSFMTPYSWLHMYGTRDQILLATQGWNWNSNVIGQEQSTYLVGLELDGASTKFISVGTVAGHLLNSFALDIHSDELRVATTIEKRWIWNPLFSIMNTDVANEGINEFVQESSTENYIITFEFQPNENGQMEEKGRVKVGEPHESIFAIRFFDDFAYVVTFEQTDPFYVVDLVDTPKVLGKFKLNGFSSYLHPLTPDNKIIVGIGQNATDEGEVTGLMITIFNATIPENPVAIASHTITNDDSRYSNSEAEWEHKSLRYIDGKLILPLSEYNQIRNEETGAIRSENFHGFIVFDIDISEESVTEHFRVSHKSRKCNYCDGDLSPRNFVYDGNLMTVRRNVVTSTDLDSGEELWITDIVIDGEEDNVCCPYYLK